MTATDLRAILHGEYRRSLPEKLAAIRTLLGRLAAEPGDEAARGELLVRLHRLRGSAGSYGFGELGQLAAIWEERLRGVDSLRPSLDELGRELERISVRMDLEPTSRRAATH